MTVIDETLFSGGQDGLLDGPDLDKLPPLALQIEVLDGVRASGNLRDYVTAWLAFSDQNGGYPMAFWDNAAPADAPAQIMVGIQCDRQEHERRARWQALHDHHQGVDGFKHAMERELVGQGRFTDNRKTSLVEIKAAVRAFLATGGRFLIAPEGSARRVREPVEVAPAAERFLKGDWSEADTSASAVMCRIARQWRARSKLDRIVRALGKAENGWIVLEGARL